MGDAGSVKDDAKGESPVLEHKNCTRVVEILKAVAHPVRLRIVTLLCRGEEHVSALTLALEVNQNIVSQQLRILRMSGLVEVSRHGGHAFYSLAEPHLRDLIRCTEQCCSARGRPSAPIRLEVALD
jgi:ArsR family transcriptional regulator